MPSIINHPIKNEIIEKELIDSAEEVIIGSEQGTTFPMKVGSTLCNALIDTGATKSCMMESYHKTLHLDSICSVVNTCVRSATGRQFVTFRYCQLSLETWKYNFCQ